MIIFVQIAYGPLSFSWWYLFSGMFRRRRACCTALHTQYQDFLERIQQTQNTWLERQLEQSHAREERLIARVLAEHTRSMEALVNQLFAGLRSLLPQSHPNLQSNPQLDILDTHPAEHWQPAHQPTSSMTSRPEDDSNGPTSETLNQPSKWFKEWFKTWYILLILMHS